MHHRPLVILAAGAVLLLTACSSGAATSAPTTAPSAAPSAEAPAAVACAESGAAGEVAVAIKDFTFAPSDITATVGQTITFTNNGSAPHTATLDDGTCTTPNIASGGGSDGLLFTVAGTYPFHCNVHPKMKGTITIG